mmetsp:Transcript_20674/g.42366  ORF Transcript_20674/g.42366 Transcript_20674/m.42366 type:complete len:456 (-) Transcript_20674:513-1880(-)
MKAKTKSHPAFSKQIEKENIIEAITEEDTNMPRNFMPGEDGHYDKVDCDREKESIADNNVQDSPDDDEGGEDDGVNQNEDESEGDEDEDDGEDEDEGDDDEWKGSEEDEGDDIKDMEEEENENENLDEVVTGAGSEVENEHEEDDGIVDEASAADKYGISVDEGGNGGADFDEEESSKPSAAKPASPDLPDPNPSATAKINHDERGENFVPVEVKSLDVAPKKNAEGHSSIAQKKRPGPVNTWQEKLGENHSGKQKRSKSQTDGNSSPARLKDPPELVSTSDTNCKNQKKTAKGGREKPQRKAKSAHAAGLPQNNQQLSQADVQARGKESLQFPPTHNFLTNQSHQLRALWYPTHTIIPPQFHPYQMAQTTNPQPMRPIPLSPAYICTPLIPNDICAPYRMAYFRVMERKRHEEQEKNISKGSPGGEGIYQEKKTQTAAMAKSTLEDKVTPGMMC